MDDTTPPPKPKRRSEQRQKDRRITVRLSLAERAELEAAADREGQTLGTYARSRILAEPTTRQRRRPPVNVELLAQAVALLGRVSGNVYQISRRLNFGELVAPADVAATLAEVRAVAAALMDAAGRSPAGPK